MQNEVRYYLELVKGSIEKQEFEPKVIVTAVQLPTGAVEVAINNDGILDKINYILEAYDDDMRLKTNPEIIMQNLMVI